MFGAADEFDDEGLYDEMFDFSFSDVELDYSGEVSPTTLSSHTEDSTSKLYVTDVDEARSIFFCISGSEASIVRIETPARKRTVVHAKSTRKSQFMKKVAHPKSSNMPHLGSCESKPNVSKRNPSNILYAFPHFDKSDALLYFPNTLSRYMNSGDMPAIKKLLVGHMDRKCGVTLHHAIPSLSARSLLTMVTILHDLRPDLIMCVSSTKVVENQIRACAYMKFTDVKSVYDSVVNTITEPIFQTLFSKKRTLRLKDGLEGGIEQRTEEEQLALTEMVESGADVLLYGALDITLTFDDVTKKIVHLGFETRLTSLLPIVQCPESEKENIV